MGSSRAATEFRALLRKNLASRRAQGLFVATIGRPRLQTQLRGRVRELYEISRAGLGRVRLRLPVVTSGTGGGRAAPKKRS